MNTPQFQQLSELDAQALTDEAAAGLLAERAALPPKFFYDELGSRLFDAITALDEYYPTRIEAAIFAAQRGEIADAVHEACGKAPLMVDLGAGSCAKAMSLFAALRPRRYVAVDISTAFLRAALERVQREQPALDVHGLGLDFSARLALPAALVDAPWLLFYPVRYWKLLDPKCTVIAVEPDPENFDLLAKNTGQLKDVHLVKAGIWTTAGTLDLAKEGVGHSAVRTMATDRGSTPAVTIPGLMHKHGITQLDLLKIDIEGSELELFTQGDLNWISQVETIAIELHDHWRPGCGDAFFQAIASYRWPIPSWATRSFARGCAIAEKFLGP